MLVTAAELAKIWGVDKSTIYRWVSDGRIVPLSNKGQDLFYDDARRPERRKSDSWASRRIEEELKDEFCNVREASEIIGVSPATIKRWCAIGSLVARKLDGYWWVSRRSLDEKRQK